jgi:hypothetical protein
LKRYIEANGISGNAYRAREEIDGMQFNAEALEPDYPNVRKFPSYIASTARATGPVNASLRPSSEQPSIR